MQPLVFSFLLSQSWLVTGIDVQQTLLMVDCSEFVPHDALPPFSIHIAGFDADKHGFTGQRNTVRAHTFDLSVDGNVLS